MPGAFIMARLERSGWAADRYDQDQEEKSPAWEFGREEAGDTRSIRRLA
jgi:hypothetical protein